MLSWEIEIASQDPRWRGKQEQVNSNNEQSQQRLQQQLQTSNRNKSRNNKCKSTIATQQR